MESLQNSAFIRVHPRPIHKLSAGYRYNHRFIDDFEVYYWESGARRKFGQQTRSDTHEVWIPIVKKETLVHIKVHDKEAAS